MKQHRILFVDHKDSFSHNLIAWFREKGFEVDVVQSSQMSVEQLQHQVSMLSAIVFSPGPGHPSEYSKSLQLLKLIPDTLPVLGVCLGHQLLLFAGGAKIQPLSDKPIHGRRVAVVTQQSSRLWGEFSGTQVFYNSLACSVKNLPVHWAPLAWCDDELFAAEHKFFPRLGVQFHPESFASQGGNAWLEAFARAVGS